MTLRPVDVEVTVEREAPSTEERGRRTIRLSARLVPATPETLPTAEELHEAIEGLTARLDTALELAGAVGVSRRGPDRDLDELVETYRPRQPELIDLLLGEGELSPREASLLRHHLDRTKSLPREPSGERVPVSSQPSPEAPRSIGELLATYQIASLKQAGAVRARRQISFAEYMALKRHFSTPETPSPAPAP